MSKGISGLFFGTKSVDVTGNSRKSNAKSVATYTETSSLHDHIVNPESSSSGKQGIKGAHHKGNFFKEVERIGAKITDSSSNSQMSGVEKISYKMPKRDKAGNPTGEYQSKTHYKTVYDSSIISSQQYINRGLEAANNAAEQSSSGKLGREWTGTDNSGVKWHGYCDSDGNITSFYPED